jgi:internalin A
LGHTQVGDAGLKELLLLKELRSLSLAGTAITDKGLKVLHALPNLQTLELSDAKISDATIVELQKALPKLIIHR